MKKIKIVSIIGARPNFMKIASILSEMDKFHKDIDHKLIHTGQHYDYNMNKIFFNQLSIPKPDIFLGVGSGLHGEQTGKILIEIEKILLKERPKIVIVVGDVNSTLASTLAAKKLNIQVAHIEAGLRSYDIGMPEEINRKVTDILSDYLFTTCKDGNTNLLKEGISRDKIFFVGNVMIDTLVKYLPIAKLKKTIFDNILSSNYLVVTLHRPSNVDVKKRLANIIDTCYSISKKIPIIFPMHPRTEKNLNKYKLTGKLKRFDPKETILRNCIYITESLGYLDFIKLYSNSNGIITDSGGIQEETTYMGIPCLTLRENTERPITITQGTNKLVNEMNLFNKAIALVNGKKIKYKIPELWDGKAGSRIVSTLMDKIT